MNLIDAHAHLMDEKFDGEVEKIINNAQEAGVTKIINIGYNKETSQKAVELAEKYDFIYATIGLHPEELETEQDITFIKEMSKNKKVVAIGEVGLTGEVRAVNMIEKRLKEAEKLGFNKCIIPENNKKLLKDNYSKVKGFELLRSIDISIDDLLDTSEDISKLVLRR